MALKSRMIAAPTVQSLLQELTALTGAEAVLPSCSAW